MRASGYRLTRLFGKLGVTQIHAQVPSIRHLNGIGPNHANGSHGRWHSANYNVISFRKVLQTSLPTGIGLEAIDRCLRQRITELRGYPGIVITTVNGANPQLGSRLPTRNGYSSSLRNLVNADTALHDEEFNVGNRSDLFVEKLHHGLKIHLGSPPGNDTTCRSSVGKTFRKIRWSASGSISPVIIW